MNQPYHVYVVDAEAASRDGLRSYRLLTECRRREPSTARIDGYLAALGGEQSCRTLPRVTDWEQFLITLPDLGETDG